MSRSKRNSPPKLPGCSYYCSYCHQDFKRRLVADESADVAERIDEHEADPNWRERITG